MSPTPNSHGEPGAAELLAVRHLLASGDAQRLIKSARLTNGEVAREVGTTDTTISRWHRGAALATGEPALRYLRLLQAIANWPTPEYPASGEEAR